MLSLPPQLSICVLEESLQFLVEASKLQNSIFGKSIEDFRLASNPERSLNFIQEGSRTHANLDKKLLYSILSNIFSNAIK